MILYSSTVNDDDWAVSSLFMASATLFKIINCGEAAADDVDCAVQDLSALADLNVRLLPLGMDRHFRRYWTFANDPSHKVWNGMDHCRDGPRCAKPP
jgi:hypothetical protein